MKNSRQFIPWLEQLERRQLLAALPDLAAYQVSTDESLAQSAHVAQQSAASFAAEVSLQQEQNGVDHVLVVKLMDLDRPRLVGIVGGPAAWTDPDGTVYLPPPHGARAVDIVIMGKDGEPLPLVRIEFDASGHILKQLPVHGMMNDDSFISGFSIPMDGMMGMHFMDMDRMMPGSLATGEHDRTHADVNSVQERDIGPNDHAMDLHFEMPMMKAMRDYMPASSHVVMGRHSPPMANDPTDEGEMTEHQPTEMELVSSPFVPVADELQDISVAADDNQLESENEDDAAVVVAEADDAIQTDSTASAEELVVSQVSFIAETVAPIIGSFRPGSRTELPNSVRYIVAAEVNNISPTPETNIWHVSGAIMVSLVSAGGAYLLDRRQTGTALPAMADSAGGNAATANR